MLTFGSLFTGIGGIDLGLERAGMRCAWQVEIDDYATRVLAKHWPDVPRLRDVREAGSGNLASVDLIAGGFPCQDISDAGKRVGIEGERSGLWSEFARIIGELRPRYVLVENVPAILTRGLYRVLSDLATSGYDAEWDCLPAAALGAPHLRARFWLLAYPGRDGDKARGNDPVFAGRLLPELCSWWASEPALCRVDDGVPRSMDRLRGLGNAVVPQAAELLGRAIVAHAQMRGLQ